MTFDEWWKSNRWCDYDKGEFVWEAATKAEREACAKVCEEKASKVYDHAKPPYMDCADAIRAR